MQPTPNRTAPGGQLLSVSCPGPTDCVAVGSAIDDAGAEVPLSETWDGSRWTPRATPHPADALRSELLDISCPAPGTCIAVGREMNQSGEILPLTEAWNGSAWSIENTPVPPKAAGAELLGVSCASSSACTGVGDYGSSFSGTILTLAEAWDGSTWSLQAARNRSGAQGSVLVGVSCAAADACVAAGSYVDSSSTSLTLAESWDGSTWSIESTPSPSGSAGSELVDVSCAAIVCTAVGRFVTTAGSIHPLAESRTGTDWSRQSVPRPATAARSGLFGVSCPTATTCTAVGEYAGTSGPGLTLAESWDGSAWAIQATPNPAGGLDSGLSGVSCPSEGACAAVGSHQSRVGQISTLGEESDGSTWTLRRTANVRGATPSFLDSVSCPSSGHCVAVGSGDVSGDVFRGHGRTLAESWDASSWTLQPTPEPAGVSYSILTSVSCSSVRFCMAVGWYDVRGQHTDHPLSERWDGSSWTVEPVPQQMSSTRYALRAVSCTSRIACTAVGQHDDADGSRTLAIRWNGSTWHTQKTPNPSGSQFNDLGGVSCVSAIRCTAVGSYVGSQDFGLTLVEVWRGTTWSIQKSPNPKGATGSGLSAVSCVFKAGCEAVGTSGDATLAERWNGTRWIVQYTPPAPTDLPSAFLAGVSCTSATACTASGYVLRELSGMSQAWVLGWNGTRWHAETIPSSAGAGRTLFDGVSCTSDSACTTVGYSFTAAGDQVTLAEAKGS